jgi:hypothetical protein
MDLLDDVEPSQTWSKCESDYTECISRLNNELDFIINSPMYAVMNKEGVCLTNAADHLKRAILELEKLQEK